MCDIEIYWPSLYRYPIVPARYLKPCFLTGVNNSPRNLPRRLAGLLSTFPGGVLKLRLGSTTKSGSYNGPAESKPELGKRYPKGGVLTEPH